MPWTGGGITKDELKAALQPIHQRLDSIETDVRNVLVLANHICDAMEITIRIPCPEMPSIDRVWQRPTGSS